MNRGQLVTCKENISGVQKPHSSFSCHFRHWWQTQTESTNRGSLSGWQRFSYSFALTIWFPFEKRFGQLPIFNRNQSPGYAYIWNRKIARVLRVVPSICMVRNQSFITDAGHSLPFWFIRCLGCQRSTFEAKSTLFFRERVQIQNVYNNISSRSIRVAVWPINVDQININEYLVRFRFGRRLSLPFLSFKWLKLVSIWFHYDY